MVTLNTVTSPGPAKKFEFIGANLCLDFCNTVGGKRGRIAREFLRGYADLLSWAEQAGLLDSAAADELRRKGLRSPADSLRVFKRALRLREAIYRIFLAPVEGRSPDKPEVSALNTELALCQSRLRVGVTDTGYAWEWAREKPPLDHPLGPIARSAADLLTDASSLKKVRQCHNDTCGWLFLDGSKNHSRCWCDMRECGNRAKVRRHRMKQRRVAKTSNTEAGQ